MDHRSLRALVAFAETGNVTRAAERLNLSQSPLSRRLRDLEASLGLALFQKSGRGLDLTLAGQKLAQEASRVLGASDAFAQLAQALKAGLWGRLNIGCVPGALHVPVLINGLRNSGSDGTAILIEQMRSEHQFEALLDSRIDLGISYRRPEGQGLVSEVIHAEPFVLATPSKVEFSESVMPFTAPPSSNDEWLRNACQQMEIRFEVRHRTDDPLAALNLVAAGLSAAFVQFSISQTPRQGVTFTILPSELDISMRLYVVHRADRSAEIGRFLDHCRA